MSCSTDRRPPTADAEVFATISKALAPLDLRAAMGDIGLLRAAVEGLAISEPRKAALLHHLWRPHRFRTLLNRFGKGNALAAPKPSGAAEIGLRSAEDVAHRLAALKADRAEPPLATGQIEVIDALLNIREKAPDALSLLHDVAVDLPSIGLALDALTARFDALSAAGVDVDALDFEASYGRTTLEYYDGFVFGFYADTRPDLPPVATGGRYDALTRAIGGGAGVPAVGGVIRPGLVLELGGAA